MSFFPQIRSRAQVVGVIACGGLLLLAVGCRQHNSSVPPQRTTPNRTAASAPTPPSKPMFTEPAATDPQQERPGRRDPVSSVVGSTGGSGATEGDEPGKSLPKVDDGGTTPVPPDQETPAKAVDPPPDQPGDQEGPPVIDFDKWEKPLDPPEEAKGMLRVNPKFDLWVDAKNKKLVLGGRVVLRNSNQLELFACLFRTKEHESIVTVKTKARDVHAMLVALGASPGKPVQFRRDGKDEYRAAYGPEIDVRVYWTDEKGTRKSARAQDWVRHVQTKKALDVPWVFAGSGFFEDNEQKLHYMGEDGELLCVSNFPSAVMDLPIASSADAANLLFEPFTENIPPVGTIVALVLTPELPVEAPDPKE